MTKTKCVQFAQDQPCSDASLTLGGSTAHVHILLTPPERKEEEETVSTVAALSLTKSSMLALNFVKLENVMFLYFVTALASVTFS